MPELPDRTHQCPAPECRRRVPRHQFACPADWGRLPAELKRGINEGYRRDWSLWTKTANAAIDWYREHAGAAS